MASSRRVRAITPAITLLILITVAVTVAIVAGVIILSQERAQASKGATIQVLVSARDAGNGYAALTVTVKNNGPEDVRINDVIVKVNGLSATVTWDQSIVGDVVKAGASADATGTVIASIGDKISVVVKASTTNTNSHVSQIGTTEVLP